MKTASVTRRDFVKAVGAGLAVSALPVAGGARTAKENYRTGLVYDSRYLEHDHSYEKPIRLETIRDRLQQTGLSSKVEPIQLLENPLPHIRRVHTESHVQGISGLPVTGEIARLAVAGVLGAVKAVSDGVVDNAFCAIRPPGHHVVNEGVESGFCYYANVAIAARYVQELGYQKVLVIDWDYHHGNGTQFFFYDDPSVLFFSTHDSNAYPGRFCNEFSTPEGVISIGSDPSCGGYGNGEGYTINVHLGDCYEAEVTNEAMLRAWDEKFLPAAESFRPDFILISAGFDSRINDYLGCFSITDEAFVSITQKAMALADAHCAGRLVSVLEGGYNPEGLASAVCAHVATLMNVDPPVRLLKTLPVTAAAHAVVHDNRLIIESAERKTVQSVEIFSATGKKMARIGTPMIRNSDAVNLLDVSLAPGRYFIRIQLLSGAIRLVDYMRER